MQHKIVNHAKTYSKKIKSEFNKSILAAITAAFGLLIALVWKDVITEFVTTITSLTPLQGKMIYALLVSFVCVIGIVIANEIFSPKEEKKEGLKEKQLKLEF